MTEQDLIDAGFEKVHVSKEDSGDDEDYSYYLLDATEGITLVSDSPVENNGDNWSVHSFELDKVFITEADHLVHFLNALKLCTQANL
jgi:hypothetical protein